MVSVGCLLILLQRDNYLVIYRGRLIFGAWIIHQTRFFLSEHKAWLIQGVHKPGGTRAWSTSDREMHGSQRNVTRQTVKTACNEATTVGRLQRAPNKTRENHAEKIESISILSKLTDFVHAGVSPSVKRGQARAEFIRNNPETYEKPGLSWSRAQSTRHLRPGPFRREFLLCYLLRGKFRPQGSQDLNGTPSEMRFTHYIALRRTRCHLRKARMSKRIRTGSHSKLKIFQKE